MAKKKEIQENLESGEVQTQSAADLPKVSVRVEQALVKLYDAAYRIRHMPTVKQALTVNHSAGAWRHDAFTDLMKAIDDAQPFVEVLRPEVKDEA